MVHDEKDPAAAAWILRFAQPLTRENDDTREATPASAPAPLAGLRFAVKDNIDVAGVPTTAACEAQPPQGHGRGRRSSLSAFVR
eukprot:gene25710-29048_t